MDEVALAIDKAGDRGVVYLPIYERLERELQKCRAKQTTLSAVGNRLVSLKLRANVDSLATQTPQTR